MGGIILRWLTLTAAIIAAAYLLEGIRIGSFFSAFLRQKWGFPAQNVKYGQENLFSLY